jgi:type II restriction enzyme
MTDLLYQAINDVQNAQCAFCRFITGNDTGKTGSHQSGFYIPKEAARILFEKPVTRGSNEDKFVEIKWQNDFTTQSRFIYYGVKTRNEYRITRFGRDFPFFEDNNVGDLLILAQLTSENYAGYVLSADDDIDEFLAFYNLSPNDTNQLIDIEKAIEPEGKLDTLIKQFVNTCDDFPDTQSMAKTARELFNQAFQISAQEILQNSDKLLINWVDAEYKLFHKIEDKIYLPVIHQKFSNVREFTELANQILNRRKSRAGKSLEHHLANVFDVHQLLYEEQVVTEGKKTPDFIFPNGECYHNIDFPAEYLISLASKTTCKDRWRQVINEADRISEKHLFTLQQGISKNQMEEMKHENIKVVVPHRYIGCFPKEYQQDIYDLSTFIRFVKNKQENTPRQYLINL